MTISTATARAGVIVALLALLVTAWVQRTPDGPDTRSPGLVDLSRASGSVPTDPVSLYLSLDVALRGTPFFKKISLNRARKPGHLGVYIFDSESPEPSARRLASLLRENAAFLPEDSTIVIDFGLINSLAQTYYPEDVSWGAKAGMVEWIVGHEVGHLMLGHSVSHFRDGSQLATTHRCRSERRELEADGYYVREVLQGPNGPYAGFRRFFEGILRAEIARSRGEPTAARLSRGVRRLFLRECGHPTIAIRAYNVLRTLNRLHEDTATARLLRTFAQTP